MDRSLIQQIIPEEVNIPFVLWGVRGYSCIDVVVVERNSPAVDQFPGVAVTLEDLAQFITGELAYRLLAGDDAKLPCRQFLPVPDRLPQDVPQRRAALQRGPLVGDQRLVDSVCRIGTRLAVIVIDEQANPLEKAVGRCNVCSLQQPPGSHRQHGY